MRLKDVINMPLFASCDIYEYFDSNKNFLSDESNVLDKNSKVIGIKLNLTPSLKTISVFLEA